MNDDKNFLSQSMRVLQKLIVSKAARDKYHYYKNNQH